MAAISNEASDFDEDYASSIEDVDEISSSLQDIGLSRGESSGSNSHKLSSSSSSKSNAAQNLLFSNLQDDDDHDSIATEDDELLFEDVIYETDITKATPNSSLSSLVLEMYPNLPWNSSKDKFIPSESTFQPFTGDVSMSFNDDDERQNARKDYSELKYRGEKYQNRKMIGKMVHNNDVKYAALFYDHDSIHPWNIGYISGAVEVKPSFEHIDNANESAALHKFNESNAELGENAELIAKATMAAREATSALTSAQLLATSSKYRGSGKGNEGISLTDIEAAKKSYSYYRAQCATAPKIPLKINKGKYDRKEHQRHRGKPLSETYVGRAKSHWQTRAPSEYLDEIAPMVGGFASGNQKGDGDILWSAEFAELDLPEQVFQALNINKVLAYRHLCNLCKTSKADDELHRILKDIGVTVRGLWTLSSEKLYHPSTSSSSNSGSSDQARIKRQIAIRDVIISMFNATASGKLSISSIIKKISATENEIKEVMSTLAKTAKGKSFVLPRADDPSFNHAHYGYEKKQSLIEKEKAAIQFLNESKPSITSTSPSKKSRGRRRSESQTSNADTDNGDGTDHQRSIKND